MIPAIANHLWQSTVFVVAAWLVTLALRNSRARVRQALWLAASLKFLVPFAVLTWIGSHIEWRKAPPVAEPSSFTIAMDQVSEPFTPMAPIVLPAPHAEIPWATIALSIWACGFAGIAGAWFVRLSRIVHAVRRATPLQLGLPIRARSSEVMLEPGVFGIIHPILLLPKGITTRLTREQLDAVIEHELCHVRHRDNLIAAIHMLVESAFWFHPLVWWIGRQLIVERERACDEAVVERGREPLIYAEAILNVCKSYIESPVACVAGVTGGGLRQRIEAIVANRTRERLSRAKKWMLAAAGAAAIAVPVAIGVVNAPALQAQGPRPKFDVISIKPCDASVPSGRSGDGSGRRGFSPGTITANCAVPMRLIEEAYGFYANGRGPTWKSVPIEGAPAWLNSERYTIAAKSETPQGRAMMFGPMMQVLLEDRFKLKIRREVREMPVYNLVLAKGGPKNLKESKPGTCIPLDMDGPQPPRDDLCKMFGRQRIAEGQREFTELGVNMAEFSDALAAMTGRNVIDKTGLDGTFDIKIQVSVPDDPPRDPSEPHRGPQDESELVFAVVQKLGMKLESAKGPGLVYVIESVERPTDNFAPPIAADHALRFDAASIKPDNPISGGRGSGGARNLGWLQFTTGRVVGTAVNAATLIAEAYDLKKYQIASLPSWAESDRFDFEGRAANAANEAELRRMLREFLIERFGLQLHRDKREMPVWVMTVAKGGLRAPEVGAVTPDRDDGRQKHMAIKHTADGFAGFLSSGPGVTMPVIDRTGLTGRYLFRVGWDEDEDFLDAAASTCGLKFEKQKAPVDIMVVDRLSKPAAN